MPIRHTAEIGLCDRGLEVELGRETMTCRISKNRAMSLDRWTKTIHDACIRMGKYQPHELLGWLVGDVLAGFGVRQAETPPDDLTGWLG